MRSEEEPLEYRAFETDIVADDVLENLTSEWVGQGWHFEDIRFVMKESSRRPVMAFLFFTRTRVPDDALSDLNA